MAKVKICGLRDYQNALMVAEAGADLIGLNFFPPSPRFIEPAAAADLVKRLRARLGAACPTLVGVFVNESAGRMRELLDYADLDCAQLSGDESPETLAALPGLAFKSIRPQTAADAHGAVKRFAQVTTKTATAALDERLPTLLLDAFHAKLYGGTGETAAIDVALAARKATPRLLLAGGLNPDNVAARARAIRPWGLDVASGVEAGLPGHKDEDKVRNFIWQAKFAK